MTSYISALIGIPISKWCSATAVAAITALVPWLCSIPSISAEDSEIVAIQIEDYFANVPVTDYLSLDYFEAGDKRQISLHPSPTQQRSYEMLMDSKQPLRLESGNYYFPQITECDQFAIDLMGCPLDTAALKPRLISIEFGPVASGPEVESYYSAAAKRARGLDELLIEENMITAVFQSDGSEIEIFCDQYIELTDSYLCRETRNPTDLSRFTFNYIVPKSIINFGTIKSLAVISDRFLSKIRIR